MRLLGRAKKESRPLDLATVEVKLFDNRLFYYNRFSCGKSVIDKFLKNKAAKTAARLEQRVFIATTHGSQNCIGFYSLQLGSDSVPDKPPDQLRHLQNHSAFPAVHLSYLGVSSEYQGRGLGKYLLQDVFDRVCSIAEHAGFYALTLQSLDHESTAFYERIGFTAYSEGGSQPKMLYPLEHILKLTGKL